MRDANFVGMFVGIESPDSDTLISMKKKQNTRRSLVDSVEKIYGAGIFVFAGFILGFDSERGSIAKPMAEAIEAMSIPVCMVGLLYALPNTQLTRRLMREGRLHCATTSSGSWTTWAISAPSASISRRREPGVTSWSTTRKCSSTSMRRRPISSGSAMSDSKLRLPPAGDAGSFSSITCSACSA